MHRSVHSGKVRIYYGGFVTFMLSSRSLSSTFRWFTNVCVKSCFFTYVDQIFVNSCLQAGALSSLRFICQWNQVVVSLVRGVRQCGVAKSDGAVASNS